MASKSAKDLAFEKERAKYRKQIRELESAVVQKTNENAELREQISRTEEKCLELQDWVSRLLEYTEMSEDDMKKIIQKEKNTAEVMEHFNRFMGITKMFGGAHL